MKIAILAALTALGQSASVPAPATTVATEAQFVRARALLDRQLLDYPTTRFKDVTADAGRICGLFNSRNRMSAYVGWQRFGVLGGGQTESILVLGGNPTADADLRDVCGVTPRSPDYSDRVTFRR